MKPVIAISMGDYNGIGPEVILKALASIDTDLSLPVAIGHEEVFHYYNRISDTRLNIRKVESADDLLPDPGYLQVIHSSPEEAIELHPGRETAMAGGAAMRAVGKGVELCIEKKADALV